MSEVEPTRPLPRVAVVGAGNVGTALARRFAAAGARVELGVRRPEPVAPKFADDRVEVATIDAAIAAAAVVVIAVPGKVALDVAREHAGALRQKILIDCNNPVGRGAGGLAWDPPAEGSLAAALAAALPDTRVVKGFNTFGASFHSHPNVGGRPLDVMLAGDDDDAKAEVSRLATAAGFHPVDAGPLAHASLLENMAVLWIHLATVGGYGREWAFMMTPR